jgi:flagellin-like hook-associated protein FlgL
MRIPNLNVSESVTQRIRDLDTKRLKLESQISTGQKITLPEDDGLRMSRIIKLDAEKGRLAQYQRNASYASEVLNAGHLNLEKLREINQRAQEIARLSGSNLNGPAIEAYGHEVNQLVEEALNRINATHRGRSLFGGMEIKPDFSHSEVVLGQMEKKTLDLERQAIGLEVIPGTRYLKQGDEVIYRLNGREYVVEAKVPSTDDYKSNTQYNKGNIVKKTETISDSIKIDKEKFADSAAVLAHLDDHDWSKDPVGTLLQSEGGGDVYILDASQIQEVAVSLSAQDNVDFFPSYGGNYSIREDAGELWLEPVDNEIPSWDGSEVYQTGDLVQWGGEFYKSKQIQDPEDPNSTVGFNLDLWELIEGDASAESYRLTKDEKIFYFEATSQSTNEEPSFGSSSWKNINPFENPSNVSTKEAATLLKELINEDAYFLADSQVKESDDYIAYVRGSSIPFDDHNFELDLIASVAIDGTLEVSGNVGKSFNAEANYISYYDSRSYFTQQVDELVKLKAASLFPRSEYDELTQAEKDLVWDAVKDSKQTFDLNVGEQQVDAGSEINIELSKPWKRLQAYKAGQIVEFEDKLWMSLRDENFNHFPTQEGSEFWREIGSGYDAVREDWNIKNSGVETRYYFTSPDGKLFDDRQDAETHTYDILVNRVPPYESVDKLFADISSMVREIGYPVSKFETTGSESSALVSFDASSQTYRLSALPDGQAQVGGLFSLGEVKSPRDDLEDSDIIQYGGNYFLVLSTEPTDAEKVSVDQVGELNANIPQGDKLLVNQYDESDPQKILSSMVFFSLGGKLPVAGSEIIREEGIELPMRRGGYVYDRPTDSYYVAKEDIADASSLEIEKSESFAKVGAFVREQGAEWSANTTYFKGQIVLHEGVYYENQTNNPDPFTNESRGFSNRIEDYSDGAQADFNPEVFSPSDKFFFETNDALSQEFMDMQRAKGEPIFNNVWLPVAQPVQHVLSFNAESQVDAQVKIEPAGVNGIDAKISLLTDANGKVTGLRVDDPGKYYFPNNADLANRSIPTAFETAEIVLADGQSFEAEVIWGENPNDPGPFIITGFSINEDAFSARTDTPMGPRLGDTYSFSTGTKTFLDHRDKDGNIIGVTYTGASENAEYYVGKDSKISSYLDAENNNTAELADLLDSIVELRNGLRDNDPTTMAQQIQSVERDLINSENEVVNKMGELSAVMVRMDTVRAHDEEYHLAIDQRLANDLDVDISDAIMRLTQISTAYQAAMQVGANLLNTSLLNYL